MAIDVTDIKPYASLQEAYLHKANLRGADLHRADLRWADLYRANLRGANLHWADLRGAYLYAANLRGANLCGANLHEANLRRANLNGANLRGANLHWADLHKADLHKANLRGAYLHGAKNIPAYVETQTSILPDGDVVGWKKCRENVIVRLLIPSAAKRSNATGRKCRAEYADVMQVVGAEHAVSDHDGTTLYVTGQRVTCPNWDDDRWSECSGGIHFFITREEAESY
jgi:Family of unknown function (DUF5758)/Pentapeptide repeats (8 copies)